MMSYHETLDEQNEKLNNFTSRILPFVSLYQVYLYTVNNVVSHALRYMYIYYTVHMVVKLIIVLC